MGALAVASTGRGWEDAGRGGEATDRASDARPAQPRLFALPGGVAEEPVAVPEPRPVLAGSVAPAARARTLDEAITGVWRLVGQASPAACPVCAGLLRPRWSAGAGAVGGRCEDCGTLLD